MGRKLVVDLENPNCTKFELLTHAQEHAEELFRLARILANESWESREWYAAASQLADLALKVDAATQANQEPTEA